MKTIKHYGWESSPFTAKTRAYLRFKNIEFDDIHPQAYTLYTRIKPAIGYIMMPVVELSDGTFLQDSSRIIDHFESQSSSITPPGTRQRLVSSLLELYADEWMPIIALYTRWMIPENRKFAQADFGRCAFPWLPGFISSRLAKSMASKMSGYLPVLGITNDTDASIRAWIGTLSNTLNTHFETHDFLLGSSPCIGDFALAAPFYAHVWRDPGSRHLLANQTHLLSWIHRVQAGPSNTGSFLPNDEIPDTILPVLKHQAIEQMPVIRETKKRVFTYAQKQPPNTSIPRSLGDMTAQIGGQEATRRVLVMNQWKAQRVADSLKGVPASDADSAIQWAIDTLGLRAEDLSEPPARVTYQGYRLILESS